MQEGWQRFRLPAAGTRDVGAHRDTFGDAGQRPRQPRQRRAATALCVLAALATAGLMPMAIRVWPTLPGFMPIYQTALILTYALSAAILFAQFRRDRSLALLLIAAGCLYTGAIVCLQPRASRACSGRDASSARLRARQRGCGRSGTSARRSTAWHMRLPFPGDDVRSLRRTCARHRGLRRRGGPARGCLRLDRGGVRGHPAEVGRGRRLHPADHVRGRPRGPGPHRRGARGPVAPDRSRAHRPRALARRLDGAARPRQRDHAGRLRARDGRLVRRADRSAAVGRGDPRRLPAPDRGPALPRRGDGGGAGEGAGRAAARPRQPGPGA